MQVGLVRLELTIPSPQTRWDGRFPIARHGRLGLLSLTPTTVEGRCHRCPAAVAHLIYGEWSPAHTLEPEGQGLCGA